MRKIIAMTLVAQLVSYSLYSQNTNLGTSSGTAGTNNSFFGYYSGNAVNSSSSDNSFFGFNSGLLTTSGIRNTGFGSSVLANNTTGNYNHGFGYKALYNITTGSANVAYGYLALTNSTSGAYNTAFGYLAAQSNTTGNYNAAFGHTAFLNNTSGSYNTSLGMEALASNTTATDNTAVGSTAASGISTGSSNTAIGAQSLSNSLTGSGDVAIGYNALFYLGGGSTDLNNTGIGYDAGTNNNSGQNTVAIGWGSTPGTLNSVYAGSSITVSIGGQVGWSTLSDGRFKTDVKEDVKGLEFVTQLRPVSYSFDVNAFDMFTHGNKILTRNSNQLQAVNKATAVRQTGFIAQEVETILKNSGNNFSGLVAPQNEKEFYSLRYGDFVVPLVKAIQDLCIRKKAQKKILDSLVFKVNSVANSLAVLNQNLQSSASNNLQITMTLPQTAKISNLYIYDINGVQLKSIPVTDRGNSSVTISGGELRPGTYFCTLIIDSQVIDTKKMILTN